jgi:hypothetical protein
MARRRWAVLVVLALVVAVGSDVATATAPVPSDPAAPAVVDDEAVAQLVEELAAAGIEVFDDPAGQPLAPAAEPRSPVRLLRDQVVAMEIELSAGAGMPADELDAAVGAAAPEDDGDGAAEIVAAAPSEVITTWMDVGGTAASELAANLLGRPVGPTGGVRPDVLPDVVLLLFASDVATVGASIPEPAGADAAAGWMRPRSDGEAVEAAAPAGPCSSVIGFVNGVVASVFNAIGRLRAPPRVHTGFSLFDTFVNTVATVVVGGVNAVIDGANFIISNTVSVAITTVLTFVGRVAGVVGSVAVVVSAIRPWSLKVVADPPNVEAPGGGSIRAAVDLGGFDEWPPAVADCAAAAGVPLPPLRPAGNPVAWSVPGEGLIATDSADPRLRPDGTAVYTYHVVKEPPLPNGPNVVEEVRVRATVQRDDLRRLEDRLLEMIRSELSQLLPPIGSVVAPLVMPLIQPWIDRAFSALSRLRDVYSVARIAVRSPDPNRPTTTTATTAPAARPFGRCPSGAELTAATAYAHPEPEVVTGADGAVVSCGYRMPEVGIASAYIFLPAAFPWPTPDLLAAEILDEESDCNPSTIGQPLTINGADMAMVGCRSFHGEVIYFVMEAGQIVEIFAIDDATGVAMAEVLLGTR